MIYWKREIIILLISLRSIKPRKESFLTSAGIQVRT